MEEFLQNLSSLDFAGDLIVNEEDEKEIDFETLDIQMRMRMRMMKVRLMRNIKKL